MGWLKKLFGSQPSQETKVLTKVLTGVPKLLTSSFFYIKL